MRLGARAARRHLDQAVVVHGIADVRELRPAVALDGGEHAAVVALYERTRLLFGHRVLHGAVRRGSFQILGQILGQGALLRLSAPGILSVGRRPTLSMEISS